MLRASQRKASFYRPTIPTNQPEPIQHSSSSPTLPPPAANHFVQETFLIGAAMRKVLSIVRAVAFPGLTCCAPSGRLPYHASNDAIRSMVYTVPMPYRPAPTNSHRSSLRFNPRRSVHRI
jgi:hypothetical protein